jgi:hypothetical protein
LGLLRVGIALLQTRAQGVHHRLRVLQAKIAAKSFTNRESLSQGNWKVLPPPVQTHTTNIEEGANSLQTHISIIEEAAKSPIAWQFFNASFSFDSAPVSESTDLPAHSTYLLESLCKGLGYSLSSTSALGSSLGQSIGLGIRVLQAQEHATTARP